MQKTTYLLLIIYVLFSSEGFCQNLTLKIKGETEVESRTIDSLRYIKMHNDYTSIKTEVDSIQNKLYKLGYIECQTKHITKINDSSFLAQFKLNHKFNTIYVYYKEDDIDISELKNVSNEVTKDYFKLNFQEVENALNYLNSKISGQGFPFSKLQLSNIKIKSDTSLDAELEVIISQKKRIINDIVIKGYEKFPKAYLKHFLKIKPLQVFDLATVKNKTEQLANLNFAKQLKPPEVLFSKDSTVLYLYIEKTTSNAFDGFLGFGTNEDTNKLEFDGYLNLNLTNNLHFGESLQLLYKSDENDQKTFEAHATLPYLFKSPIGVDVALRIFKKDSSFTTTNQMAKLHYQINAKHKVYGGITSTESNYLRSTTSSTIQDYNTNLFNIGHLYTNTQPYHLLFPIKSKFFIETGIGKRKTDFGTEKQVQLNLDAFNIFNLNNKNAIYLRTKGSYLISDSYYENELFRFGGINSIRGFEENSLFASLFSFINSEYRFQLSNSIYIHSIFDAGYFENKITDTQQKLFGYGFGFGILTNAGLFKLNYANGKTEDSNFKLSNSKVHLSLTANF
ncbi:POTRA domain-containing protein [Flavisericum labens]|uniref:POTRA domain-containing protein n=1 Tax=Flavisericum labens TaxID=3377112 RepID=UPI00387B7E8D